jgi:hypothetical protein
MDTPRSGTQHSHSIDSRSPRGARAAGCKIKVLLGMLAIMEAITAHAAGNSAADPTVTIACFGSDLSLTSAVGSGDSVRLCAEVLDFGQATTVPQGKVLFLVDGSVVGPAAGVVIKPGQDPRTSQPAGIAAVSLSSAHLSPGAHTVKARYIPAGSQFLASQSSAAGNLQFNRTTMLASAGGSTNSAQHGVSKSGKETVPASAESYNLVEPANKRFWVSGEYDFTWFFGDDSHSLIVKGPNPTVSPVIITGGKLASSPGFIGPKKFGEFVNPFELKNATGTEFGHSLDTGAHQGQEAQLGYWLDPEETRGIEGSFFYTESASSDFTSPRGGVTAIPYLNLSNGQMEAYTVSQPFTTYTSNTYINTTPAVFVHLHQDTVSTTTTGNASAGIADRMWGTDLKFRQELPTSGNLTEASLSLGAAYFNFYETMGIGSEVSSYTTDSTVYDKSLGLPGHPNYTNIYQSSAAEADTFNAHNQFYGLQAGARLKYQWGKLWISGEGDLGLGIMNENLDVNGHTRSTATSTVSPTKTIKLAGIPLVVANGKPAVTTTTSDSSNYGLFSQPENAGSRSQDEFAVMPSVSVKVGYDFTPSLTIFAGYYFFYVNSVLRPGDQFNQKGLVDSSLYGQTAEIGLKVSF